MVSLLDLYLLLFITQLTFAVLEVNGLGFLGFFIFMLNFFSIFIGRYFPESQTSIVWTLILIFFSLIDLYCISTLTQVTGQYLNAFSNV